MIIKGTNNTATVFNKDLEETARSQIEGLCNQSAFGDSKIRIMPDVHAGKGCTIGTTMTISERVVPAHVGVDIGCTVSALRIDTGSVDFNRLDTFIKLNIPSGFNCRSEPLQKDFESDLRSLYCLTSVNQERAMCSLGTLGGGNHFIEVDLDDEGNFWLVLHTGSRNLGTCVAGYFQEIAERVCGGGRSDAAKEIIKNLREQGRQSEISAALSMLPKEEKIAPEFCYLEGENFERYLHDMRITQKYALLNHELMAREIFRGMGWGDALDTIVTTHNYIDLDNMILRKGAVSAQKGQRLLVPLNMRDGTLICVGKGNPDWNFSAPHGAGRLMSRSGAKKAFTLDQFKESMRGIQSSTICMDTLDECAMAYKPYEEIMAYVEPTVDIVCRMRPLYNFKAAE